MKYINVRYLIIVIIITLNSCYYEEIIELRIVYMPQYMESPIPIKCREGSPLMKRRRITDKDILKEFSKIMKDVKSNKDTCNTRLNSRVNCLITYKNRTDTLCLGAFWGTELNSEAKCDNKELFDLIYDLIYKDDDEESWLPSFLRDSVKEAVKDDTWISIDSLYNEDDVL